jgi:hypothetical protein
MKKSVIFAIVALATAFVACTSTPGTESATVDTATVVVDSTSVDSAAMTVDTCATK